MSNWVQYGEVKNESKLYVNIQTGKKRQVDWRGRVYEFKEKDETWYQITAKSTKPIGEK